MKITILGATGNSGRALTQAAIRDGHQVTALVRDPQRMERSASDRLTVRAVDLVDHVALVEALRGHDAVINAAGHVSDHEEFVPLVGRVITAAGAALGEGGRFWTYGGAALLDVPGTAITTVDLPGVPKRYEAHRTNFAALHRSRLDWSIVCPGPMIPSPDGRSTDGLVLSSGQWATPVPRLLPRLPRAMMALAFKRSVSRITVYYEDVARVILDNLDSHGEYSRARVGIALPEGIARTKGGALPKSAALAQ